MATDNSTTKSSITPIEDVPNIYQQSNHFDFALKLNQQNLVLFQSIYPPLSHQHNTVHQKWTSKTDDDAIHSALASHRKINIIKNKILKHIGDTKPHHRRPRILHVPSKNILLVFYEGPRATNCIGRFNLNTEKFESTRTGITARGITYSIGLMHTESVVLSSNESYVVIINVLSTMGSQLWRMGYVFLNILDIRNPNEYSLSTSKVKIDHLLWGDRMYFECLLIGPTDSTAFVRLWIKNILRQQQFKGMDIAFVLISLICRYYTEPMMHLLQFDRTNRRNRQIRHWMISEKDILKPTVNGWNRKLKIRWSNGMQ